MIFYSNFFINLTNSIAISSSNFISECKFLLEIIVKLMIGAIIIITIPETIRYVIKSFKDRRILNEEIPKIALIYYKEKYNKELSNYSLELDYTLNSMHAIKYSGSGYLYIDNKKSKYIYVNLNSNFELLDVYDNIEDDVVIEDINSALSNIKNNDNISYFVKLNRRPYTRAQYPYSNIKEYFTKNINIKPNIIIVHKAEEDNYRNYCSNYAKCLSDSIKEHFNDIDIEIGFYFTKNDYLYHHIINTISECTPLDNSPMFRLTLVRDNYLMKKDNYYYYVFED